MTRTVMLMVGTRKGAFLLESGPDRRDWTVRGPLCEGWPVYDVSYDPASGAILAGSGSPWFGPAVWRSTDLGETWTHSSAGLTYGDEGPAVTRVWNVTPADGTLYAGVEPAGLFRSTDGGESWTHVPGLREHPSRPQWQPGAGGLMCHTIIPDPADPAHLWVGISAVGVFETRDGGATWATRNKGVRAEFHPERYPEFGQCVHKAALAPGGSSTLYQQNHCGVYRSDDAGASWTEITGTLPSDFGFAIGVHPRDPRTAWVVPLTSPEQGRHMPEGKVAVWRTRDGGSSWGRLSTGLPQEHAFLGVLREAMAVDELDPAGVYFGTSTGQLYGSADEGETWTAIAEHLPSIASVGVAVVER
ncbi:MAG TPA: hypothetical protein VF763_05020 [Candidatus Limnocylindrales bacterium]